MGDKENGKDNYPRAKVGENLRTHFSCFLNFFETGRVKVSCPGLTIMMQVSWSQEVFGARLLGRLRKICENQDNGVS